MKGRTATLSFTADGLKQARRHFEKALELDPNLVAARSYLGFTHAMDRRMGYALDPEKSLALAERFIAKALELHPAYPLALGHLAIVRVIQKRAKDAQKLAYQAAELAPSDAAAIGPAAWVLKYSGQAKKSLPFFAKAKRLQPVLPWWLVADEFGAHLDAKEYAAARVLAPAYLAADYPDNFRPAFLVTAALSHLKTGDRVGAEALVAEALKLKPDLSLVDQRPFDIAYIDKFSARGFTSNLGSLGRSCL